MSAREVTTPIIGIVIPVYNGSTFLDETLRAVQRQSFADWRCVMVDDGSTDDSLVTCHAFVQEDSRFLAVSQANQGISAARNTGSRYITDCALWTFMDQDDVWLPGALKDLHAAATQEGVIGAHAVAETVDAAGVVLPGFSGFMRARARPGLRRFRDLVPVEPTDLASVLFVNRVYPPGVLLVKQEAYELAGPWDSSYMAVQDWDMLVRLLAVGPLTFVDEVLVHYRRHGKNESDDSQRNVLETRRLHVASFGRLTPTIGRPQLRRWWRQWELLKISEAEQQLPSPRAFARIAVHLWRYVRGWPSTGRLG